MRYSPHGQSIWIIDSSRTGEEGRGAGPGGSRKERLGDGCRDRRYRRHPGVLRENGRHAERQRERGAGQGAIRGALQTVDESVPGCDRVGRRRAPVPEAGGRSPDRRRAAPCGRRQDYRGYRPLWRDQRARWTMREGRGGRHLGALKRAMVFTTLISTETLFQHLDDPAFVVID